MEIIYTEYAEETISDRNISRDDIEDAILHPDEVVKGRKGRKIAHKSIDDKLLRVVYEVNTKAYIVITAYFTKLSRYRKK